MVVRVDVRKLLARPVAFYPSLVPVAGSVNAAIMLCQAIYWSDRTDSPNGSFWKDMAEWTRETGLGRHEQEGARKLLRGTSFWSEKYDRIGHKLFYHIEFEGLERAIIEAQTSQPTPPIGSDIPESQKVEMGKAEIRHSGLPESGNGDCRNSEVVKEQRVLPESTSENTSRRQGRAADGSRQRAFSDRAVAMFTAKFWQAPTWDSRQYVQLARLLKHCPELAVEEFTRRYANMLESPVEFHRQQVGDLAFFCTKFDQFIEMPQGVSYGRSKQASLKANCEEGWRRFEERHRPVAIQGSVSGGGESAA